MTSCLPLAHRVPGADFSYSDHEAVQTVFQVDKLLVSYWLTAFLELTAAIQTMRLYRQSSR
jgi:hypothetical protein